MNNKELRKTSGSFTTPSTDRLTAFLYDLMRDHMSVGDVEKLVRDAESLEGNVKFTNGYLAEYAHLLASRLTYERMEEIKHDEILFNK